MGEGRSDAKLRLQRSRDGGDGQVGARRVASEPFCFSCALWILFSRSRRSRNGNLEVHMHKSHVKHEEEVK